MGDITYVMAKKNKENKKQEESEKAQEDDQVKSNIEVEDDYNLDHITHKDKLMIVKIVENNDELEEDNEKQEQSLHKQEMFLISCLQKRNVSYLKDGRTKGSKSKV